MTDLQLGFLVSPLFVLAFCPPFQRCACHPLCHCRCLPSRNLLVVFSPLRGQHSVSPRTNAFPALLGNSSCFFRRRHHLSSGGFGGGGPPFSVLRGSCTFRSCTAPGAAWVLWLLRAWLHRLSTRLALLRSLFCYGPGGLPFIAARLSHRLRRSGVWLFRCLVVLFYKPIWRLSLGWLALRHALIWGPTRRLVLVPLGPFPCVTGLCLVCSLLTFFPLIFLLVCLFSLCHGLRCCPILVILPAWLLRLGPPGPLSFLQLAPWWSFSSYCFGCARLPGLVYQPTASYRGLDPPGAVDADLNMPHCASPATPPPVSNPSHPHCRRLAVRVFPHLSAIPFSGSPSYFSSCPFLQPLRRRAHAFGLALLGCSAGPMCFASLVISAVAPRPAVLLVARHSLLHG